VLLWSTVASAFKISLRYFDFVELLAYSSLVSTVLLAGIVLATGKIEEVVGCTWRQWAHSCLLGLLNPFLYYLVLFKAYELLPAQQAQPINYTWALVLPILSVPLLRQRIGAADFAGLVLGYLGVLVISTEGHPLALRFSNPAGVLLALGSTVIWALYWIGGTKDTRSPVVCLFQSFACGLAPTWLYFLISHAFRAPSWQGLAGAAYVGTFEMSLTFVLWLLALRFSENTAKVSSLIFLSPCVSLGFIHFVLGESVRASTLVGLSLILVGLAAQKSWSTRARASQRPASRDPGPAATERVEARNQPAPADDRPDSHRISTP
jgi:drug/metabolite transporter (DMT)-like permease